MNVYILFVETNCGRSEESDGYVHSVYATNEAAEAARLKAMDEALERDTILYWDERTMQDGDENADDWEEDYEVRQHQVIEG